MQVVHQRRSHNKVILFHNPARTGTEQGLKTGAMTWHQCGSYCYIFYPFSLRSLLPTEESCCLSIVYIISSWMDLWEKEGGLVKTTTCQQNCGTTLIIDSSLWLIPLCSILIYKDSPVYQTAKWAAYLKLPAGKPRYLLSGSMTALHTEEKQAQKKQWTSVADILKTQYVRIIKQQWAALEWLFGSFVNVW